MRIRTALAAAIVPAALFMSACAPTCDDDEVVQNGQCVEYDDDREFDDDDDFEDEDDD